MRKWLIGMVMILSLLLISLSAQAQTFVLDKLMATVEIPDTYIAFTPDTVSAAADWLSERGVSSEDTVNDMIKRGVLLQAWDQDDTARRFELTATQDETKQMIYDVNEQTEDYRRSYRTGFYPKNLYTSEGYTFSSSNWKNTDSGRFLILEYVLDKFGEVDHRGLMRRTIRNGYEITLDMQVYGRRAEAKDNTALNKIWDTFTFVEILPLPAAAQAQINITSKPPQETNVADFVITGTAAAGVKLTAVVMGLNYPDPLLSEVEVGSDGKISLPISIPREGVFMVTVTANLNGESVAELAYPVTYQRTLLAVNVLSDVPETVSSDSLTIQGTAEPKAEIQVFVNDEKMEIKEVSTDGRFTVEIDTKNEGTYEVVLAFSKKGLADRRFTFTFSRSWSTEDMVARVKSDSVSPSYSALTKNVERYDGRTINYKAYLVEVTQSGDDWIYKMALNKSGDSYSNFILVVASEQPAYDIGTRLMMYGTSVGMSLPADEAQADSGQTVAGGSYPCFDLLLLTTIE
jgi:hypothetical protein